MTSKYCRKDGGERVFSSEVRISRVSANFHKVGFSFALERKSSLCWPKSAVNLKSGEKFWWTYASDQSSVYVLSLDIESQIRKQPSVRVHSISVAIGA